MKKLLFTGLFAALIVACFAQKPYKVVFYNFENLFDTIRNPEIYDEEFTRERLLIFLVYLGVFHFLGPSGVNSWS